MVGPVLIVLICFNPRLREGGDRHPKPNQPRNIRFNPRLREGGDLAQAGVPAAFTPSFNPRLREGGDHIRLPSSKCPDGFQSTPPRGRRLGQSDRDTQKLFVSIHASAREATLRIVKLLLIGDVSIHASAREATICRCWRR